MSKLNQESVKITTSSRLRNWFLASLTLANFSTNMMDFLVSIFLVDIAIMFLGSASNLNVGSVSSLITISNIVSLIVGLLLGALSLRVRYKILLMTGLLCITFGAIGCSLAPNLLALLIFYPLDGAGTVLISSMAYTLAGEHLPLTKRGKAISYIMAGSPISGLIGSFVIWLFFGETAGWRSFMVLYVLPISVVSLILVYFYVPSLRHSMQVVNSETIKEKISHALASRNAIACLVGNLFRYIGSVWGLFAIAFIRTEFGLPTAAGAIIKLIGNIGTVLGIILAGYLVNRVGRKRLVTVSTFCLGIVGLAFILSGNILLTISLWITIGIVGGISVSSDISFTLEMTPKSRGSFMSINGAFMYLGIAIGGAMGGLVLANFNYQFVGFMFTSFIFVASVIFLTLTKEPCKGQEYSIK